MKTAEQRKAAFLQELNQLCAKHKCEMSLSDNGKPYGLHSPTIVFSFDGVYDGNFNPVEEFGEFELDSFYVSSGVVVAE